MRDARERESNYNPGRPATCIDRASCSMPTAHRASCRSCQNRARADAKTAQANLSLRLMVGIKAKGQSLEKKIKMKTNGAADRVLFSRTVSLKRN
jgi:hypothetical protein